MASDENIKVAVRLRPFIECIRQEVEGKVKRIVDLDELSASVQLTNLDNPVETHKFSFDNVLWSFDGYSEQSDGYLTSDNKAVSDEIYCDQKQVYDEIGKELVQNLWNGHNTAIFTLGETRSGKSWTLFGLGVNKGILPMACTDIFKSIRDKEKTMQQNGSSLEVRLCMAEIYNERIKDLLVSSQSSNPSKMKSALKIRQHSRKGFYIEGLRSVLVVNNEDLQQRLEDGLYNRAVYLTSFNATSDNSMTFVAITLVQRIRNHRGDEVTRVATLEVFDLPACEYMGQCDEDTLETYISTNPLHLRKNGIHSLAQCVEHLLEASVGKHQEFVEYENHAVIKLLKNALSGNSRTWMMAALSPSNFSYKNSLYVLKLAERIRMLSTRSMVNEEVTSKLVRETKGENERLKKLITLGGDFEGTEFSLRMDRARHSGSMDRDTARKKIVEDVKAQIRENEKELRNIQLSYEERLKPFKAEKNDLSKRIENDRKNKCHIYNMSKDAQVSGKVVHIIPFGTVDFGHSLQPSNGKSRETNYFIFVCGPGIREHHGSFSYNSKDGKVSIKPGGPDCSIFINETQILFDTVLSHNDRIILGGGQLWIYQNPKETWLEKYAFTFNLNYDSIMDDFAVKTEFFQTISNGSVDENLKNQILRLLPALEDAASMSNDLNQGHTFQPLLLHPIEYLLHRGSNDTATTCSNNEDSKSSYIADSIGCYSSISKHDIHRKSTVTVKVQSTVDGLFSYWSLDTFYERLELMKESYIQMLEDGDLPLKDIDAFRNDLDHEVPIGYSVISLKPLAYLVNIENPTVPILDYVTFQQIGTLNVSIYFCDGCGGKINDAEVFLDCADELLHENYTFIITLKDMQNVIHQFKEIYCKYQFLEESVEVTKYLDVKASSFTGMTIKHEKRYSMEPVTQNILNLLLTQHLVLRIYGKQRSHKLLNLFGYQTTHSGRHIDGDISPFCNPIEMENTLAHLKIKEVTDQRRIHKLNALKAIVEQSEMFGEGAIPVNVVKTLVEAKSKLCTDQRLKEHKELLTAPAPPDETFREKELPPELKALKRFSEICCIV